MLILHLCYPDCNSIPLSSLRDGLNQLGRNDFEEEIPITQDFDTPIRPAGECFLFQCMLAALQDEGLGNSAWTLRRIRLPNGALASVFWEDYLALYAFANRNGISEQAGDDLLRMLRDMHRRHGISMALPQSFRTVKRAFSRHKKNFPRRIIECSVNIPESIIPLGDSRKNKNKIVHPTLAVGYRLSVIESVSRVVLAHNYHSYMKCGKC